MENRLLKYSATIAIDAPKTSPVLFRGDLCTNIIRSKKYGFDAVELHIRNPEEIDAKEVNKRCFENGIVVSTIGTGMSYAFDGLSITDLDVQKRNMALKRLKKYIDLAEELNCGIIIGSMRGKVNPEHYEEHMAVYADCLLEVSHYAQRKGVPVYIEAINRYEVNFHNTIEEMVNYIESLDGVGFKILVDTFHMNIEEADREDRISKYSKYIGHVHFADSNRKYPGSGHVNFAAIINALEEVGYTGYVAFEYLPYPDSDIAAQKGIEYIRTLEKNNL